MKLTMTTAAFVLAATTAHAGVTLVSSSPTYHTETIYETVEVCTDKGDNFIPGAILGGIIGNNTGSGDAAAGAIIGGLLGHSQSGVQCHTERRVAGTTQVHNGYNVTLDVDGVITTVHVPLSKGVNKPRPWKQMPRR